MCETLKSIIQNEFKLYTQVHLTKTNKIEKMKRAILIASIVLGLISCHNDPAPTQAQLNAARLKHVIGTSTVTSLFIEVGSATLFNSTIPYNGYTITSEGFLVVESNSYSLEKLIMFQYYGGRLWLQY